MRVTQDDSLVGQDDGVNLDRRVIDFLLDVEFDSLVWSQKMGDVRGYCLQCLQAWMSRKFMEKLCEFFRKNKGEGFCGQPWRPAETVKGAVF